MTTIYFYCPSPAPTLNFTPDLLYTRGLGGAEQSLIVLTRELAARGHTVYVFNNAPLRDELYDGVHYCHKRFFPVFFRPNDPDKIDGLVPPDVLVLYRAPADSIVEWVRMLWHDTSIVAWSCDQATEGNYFSWLAGVDRVVTISPFHTQFFLHTYYADPAITHHIDLPIVASDYAHYNDAPRENLFLWSSQHERGLARLAVAWDEIKDAIPDAKLVITADHRLWGVNWTEVYERTQRGYKDMFFDPEVEFLAAIPKAQLVSYQKRAKLQLSSLTYDELFCISVMEAQAAGAIPVVGSQGALPTTVMVGECVGGNLNLQDPLDNWVERVIAWAKRPDLPELSRKAHELALARCAPSVVAAQWETLFDSCAQELRQRKGLVSA